MSTKFDFDITETKVYIIEIKGPDGQWGAIRAKDGKLIFEGENVDATAKIFFEALKGYLKEFQLEFDINAIKTLRDSIREQLLWDVEQVEEFIDEYIERLG